MIDQDAIGKLDIVTSSHLLVRPPPYPEEAAPGYLNRLRLLNGISSQRALFRCLVEIGEGDSRIGLIKATGVSPEIIDALIGPYPSYWGLEGNLAGLSAQDFNRKHMRWCPQCLKSLPYLRGLWTLKLQCVCVVHGVYLLDRCGCCGQPQWPAGSDFKTCVCGAELSAMPAIPAEAHVLAVGTALGRAFMKGVASVLPGPKLSAVEWLRLIRFLGGYSEASQPARPGQVSDLHLMNVANPLVAGIGHLLSDWPRMFHTLLRAIQDREASNTSLRQAFSGIYRVLYRELRHPAYQFLRDAFERYINEHWWGLVCKRNRWLQPDTLRRHPRMTIGSAAEQASISPMVLRHMVQAELIPSDLCRKPSGRSFWSINREAVELVLKAAVGAKNLQETAKALALPERRVRELVQAGILSPLISKTNRKAATWLFPREAVAPLSELSGQADERGGAVALIAILKSWRLRPGEFPTLVAEILEGRITVIGTEPVCIGRLRVSVESMQQWLYDHRVAWGEPLSIDDAARFLGLKQQVAYELVTRGFLRVDGSRSATRVIPMVELREFARTYMSLAEVARLHATSPRALLKKIAVRPVTGPTVDGGRQYFFRRADLEKKIRD